MEIYFIRHGQTQYNLEQRFQGGGCDSPLLASGVTGAKQAGAYLKDTRFAKVYSSPQLRALNTAKYVVAPNRWQPAITLDSRFKEMDFGRWEGQIERTAEPRDQYDLCVERPEKYQPELAAGGESYPEFLERVTAAVYDAVATVGLDCPLPLLIVSHGLTTTFGIKALMNVPIKDLRKPFVVNGQALNANGAGIVDNDSLTVLETHDNQTFTIKRWNETSYLH
ncbi:histidine phosphatase family protein [Lactiplantibacillus garii]|uniref:Histidine phosphatase family protein n=1 Tax=Lactiplantibacillus garii TaxID=2306423 RepID=A0A426DAK3_9LACO|nr:histidine phosphatase family protein [Lactiplantibacillus garii]RRK11658.1 histidine phosphatase family protein [Lactiplantibacillus garii]